MRRWYSLRSVILEEDILYVSKSGNENPLQKARELNEDVGVNFLTWTKESYTERSRYGERK